MISTLFPKVLHCSDACCWPLPALPVIGTLLAKAAPAVALSHSFSGHYELSRLRQNRKRDRSLSVFPQQDQPTLLSAFIAKFHTERFHCVGQRL